MSFDILLIAQASITFEIITIIVEVTASLILLLGFVLYLIRQESNEISDAIIYFCSCLDGILIVYNLNRFADIKGIEKWSCSVVSYTFQYTILLGFASASISLALIPFFPNVVSPINLIKHNLSETTETLNINSLNFTNLNNASSSNFGAFCEMPSNKRNFLLSLWFICSFLVFTVVLFNIISFIIFPNIVKLNDDMVQKDINNSQTLVNVDQRQQQNLLQQHLMSSSDLSIIDLQSVVSPLSIQSRLNCQSNQIGGVSGTSINLKTEPSQFTGKNGSSDGRELVERSNSFSVLETSKKPEVERRSTYKHFKVKKSLENLQSSHINHSEFISPVLQTPVKRANSTLHYPGVSNSGDSLSGGIHNRRGGAQTSDIIMGTSYNRSNVCVNPNLQVSTKHGKGFYGSNKSFVLSGGESAFPSKNSLLTSINEDGEVNFIWSTKNRINHLVLPILIILTWLPWVLSLLGLEFYMDNCTTNICFSFSVFIIILTSLRQIILGLILTSFNESVNRFFQRSTETKPYVDADHGEIATGGTVVALKSNSDNEGNNVLEQLKTNIVNSPTSNPLSETGSINIKPDNEVLNKEEVEEVLKPINYPVEIQSFSETTDDSVVFPKRSSINHICGNKVLNSSPIRRSSIQFNVGGVKAAERAILVTLVASYIILGAVKIKGKTPQTISFLGLTASLVSICMFGSPLVNVMKVFSSKSSKEILSFSLSFCSLVASLSWMTFGFNLEDVYIWFPNGIASILALVSVKTSILT
ncbi:hypothetical protein HDU92_000453 [Lobulomyces angularis]|nr:hypothetical protein HDU92_000453 [Lobulomyces angularis]